MIDALYYMSLVFTVVLALVKRESLEKISKTLTNLNALWIANPFSFSSCYSELAQMLILKLFQEG